MSLPVFIPDSDFPEEWAHLKDARKVAGDVAGVALRHAQRIAPVRTGEYRDSLSVEVAETADGWAGLVSSDDPKAPFIEFGTEDTPTFATLRRALEATGARRKEG